MTLGDFAKMYTQGDYAIIYGGAVSKESKKNASGSTPLVRIPLEIYIDKVAVRLGHRR